MSEPERVTLVGNLTADPELRSTPSGLPVTSMRIAVTPRTRQEDGTWTDGEILRALIRKVEVGEDAIRIEYKVGPPPFDRGPDGAVSQDCGRGDFPVTCEHLSALVREGVRPERRPRDLGQRQAGAACR